MSESQGSEVYKLGERLVACCRQLGLLNSDHGKAALRIYVSGLEAKLGGLKLSADADASTSLDMLSLAFTVFDKLQRAFHATYEDWTFPKEKLEEFKRAVGAVETAMPTDGK